MKIQEFSRLSGLSAKTIRYYESIRILPSPPRTSNGYRDYREKDLERVRFVAGIRSLDLSLDEIAEILAMRDRREAPCRTLLDQIEQKADQIEERIRVLRQMETDLRQLHDLGLTFPTDDVDGKNGTTMPDPRVTHFWDGETQVGQWFAEEVERYRGVSWDTYYLYGPEAKWDTVPPSLASSGGTIYHERETLRTQLSIVLEDN